MTESDLKPIFIKTLLAGSIASQLVFTFYRIFFTDFELNEMAYAIPYLIADILFSFIILFIPLMFMIIYILQSKDKIFNFKKFYIIHGSVIFILGVIPLTKEILINDLNTPFLNLTLLHLIITYLLGYLFFENFRLKIAI
jgi:hypothetical protein